MHPVTPCLLVEGQLCRLTLCLVLEASHPSIICMHYADRAHDAASRWGNSYVAPHGADKLPYIAQTETLAALIMQNVAKSYLVCIFDHTLRLAFSCSVCICMQNTAQRCRSQDHVAA